MKVELIHNTPLFVASKAIRKCWSSEDKSDTQVNVSGGGFPAIDTVCGTKDKELIYRVGNKNKHASTLEHLNYSFDIDGISRACLQELARHRMASLSVKSTRYTLKELIKYTEFNYQDNDDREEAFKFLVSTGDKMLDTHNIKKLNIVMGAIRSGRSNDIVKYMIPEAYKTSLVLTVNARSLQNFLSLRTDKAALWEIRNLANEIYNQLPEEHKYLFTEFIKDNNDIHNK